MAESGGRALQVAQWITRKGFAGVGPLSSSVELAREYQKDDSYADDDERVEALIRWETSKNFITGFVTGLGGWVTLPAGVAGGLGASWLLQARMAGAIARIHGHDLREDRVRTLVLACLVGDAAKEAFKAAGVRVGKRLAANAVKQMPGRVLIAINRKIGMRLLTKTGQRGVLNLVKIIPGIGGLVSGGVDAAACRAVGRVAHRVFKPAAAARRRRAAPPKAARPKTARSKTATAKKTAKKAVRRKSTRPVARTAAVPRAARTPPSP